MNEKELREAALSLPPDERANLAHDLIRSLDHPAESEADIDTAWVAEIEKRARELADGTVAPVDWEEAKSRIVQRLRARES